MNSVSPSAVQYAGGAMQDELVESRRQRPLERQGSFGPRPARTPDPSREATGEPDEMDKLKAKLMTAWNNVKYGSYFVPRSCSLSLLLLGQCVFIYMCIFIGQSLCSIQSAALSPGWTVKSKTSFNKISPVTVLGHSYLLNNEGKLQIQKRVFKISLDKHEIQFIRRLNRPKCKSSLLFPPSRPLVLHPIASSQMRWSGFVWLLCPGSG